jgi:hypothetical protein
VICYLLTYQSISIIGIIGDSNAGERRTQEEDQTIEV